MKISLPRELYIPKSAQKVSDKHSDAVAYLYRCTGLRDGKPAAMIFYGQQSKPVANFRYSTEAAREKSIADYFNRRRDHQQRVRDNRQSPSSIAVRNAALKRLLEEKHGKGKVRVTGDRGTATGWIRVKFLFPRPKGVSYGTAQHEIVELAKAHGLRIYSYDSGDYGSGYELAVDWTA
jgi:hypothetical protein